MNVQRVTVIVLDGVGAGEAPDAAEYGDVGTNSLGNTARAVGGLLLPNMERMGLGYITAMDGVPPAPNPTGGYGRMQPRSAGKDTVAGHWEMMGVYLPEPFPTYPNGFPPEVLDEFTARTGLGVLANKPASGTEIIQEFGAEHMRTGKPIVYTSADSVFQIAAHEEVIPLEELYRISEISRAMLTGKHGVGRVIARPFVGDHAGNFKRTEHRRDYPRTPQTPTMMDRLIAAGKQVYSVGKIDDIFGHRGITTGHHTTNNLESIKALIDYLGENFDGLLFANLIEFDMIYGHRNDPKGYAAALAQFDDHVPAIQAAMREGDICIVTGDHGVDPTTPGTDHSREYVPLLVFGPRVHGVDLDTRKTLADIGATIAEAFGLDQPEGSESFLRQVVG
ncbi:MAG: phosphopentomutase [Anaerolineae bacterium]